MKYQEKYIIRDYELDSEGHMLPCYLSYYTQETAERCITEEKYGSLDMQLIEHRAYIISGLSLEVFGRFKRYSELTVRSWVSEGHGAVYPRHYEFVGEDGSVIARGSADWVVIDTDTKKLVRWGEYDLGEVSMDEPLNLNLTKRLRPSDDIKYNLADTFKVGRSQTDLNCHMNNVSYLSPMFDNVPIGDNMTLCSINIRYKHECLEGELIDVWVSDRIAKCDNPELAASIDPSADEIYIVRMIKDGAVRAEAAWGFKVSNE